MATGRQTTNPGYVDSELYKTDPDTQTVPDRRHHEYDIGMDANILGEQADIQVVVPLIPSQDQKDALDANASLNAGNGVASIADVAAAAATAFGLYSFRTDLTAPANGEIKLDNADPNLATEVKVANLNINGSNIGNLLLLLGANDAVLLQGQAGDLYNYDITGVPVQTGGSGSGGYVTLPVAAFDITGTLSDLETTTALFLYDGNNTRFLQKASNLSDLVDPAAARTNLSVYSTAEALAVANNLSDLADNATARANLGVYSTAQTYTQTEVDTNFLAVANNLSDVSVPSTALANLSGQPLDADLTAIAGITGVDGDIIIRSGGVWTKLAKGADTEILTLAAGLPSWAAGSGGFTAATQGEMETATDNTVGATPLNTKWHPGVAKGWVQYSTGMVIQADYNVDSVTDNATGNATVIWGDNFTTAEDYVVLTVIYGNGGVTTSKIQHDAIPFQNAAGTTQIISGVPHLSQLTDDWVMVGAFGEQV